MTTAIAPLDRTQHIAILNTYLPQNLLESLGGVENILKTIPQNNNFSHPTDHHLVQWYHKTKATYEKINPKHPTEISISKSFVIFIFKRGYQNNEHIQHSIKEPSTATLFLFGNELGNWVFSPFLSKNDRLSAMSWAPPLDRPYMENFHHADTMVQLVQNPDNNFHNTFSCTENAEADSLSSAGFIDESSSSTPPNEFEDLVYEKPTTPKSPGRNQLLKLACGNNKVLPASTNQS